ncbi:hypothetical protein [Caballeronia sp. INML2]|jgi:transposase|uniref:hypothetical protein n=1 Tax=Caballeronia sp. INML2 TaxID=2921748 RepID=UPI002027BEB9|nr:hypothetical protein [Caballeronia sp. INML2]
MENLEKAKRKTAPKYSAEVRERAVRRAIVETGVRGVEKRRKKAVAIEGECCFSR